MTREREKEDGRKRETRHCITGVGWVTNRRRVKVDGMDGYFGVFLVAEENDARVVCVLSLHLLAADTMMRQIVREKR